MALVCASRLLVLPKRSGTSMMSPIERHTSANYTARLRRTGARMHILRYLPRATLVMVCLLAATLKIALAQSSSPQIGRDDPLRTGEEQQAAVRVNEAIFLAYGFGNTYMVTTRA